MVMFRFGLMIGLLPFLAMRLQSRLEGYAGFGFPWGWVGFYEAHGSGQEEVYLIPPITLISPL
jgi:hypothetical protein